MAKDKLFEAVVVLLLIVLAFLMYVMVTSGGPSASDQWDLSGIISDASSLYYGNMFVGDDGSIYTVDGTYIHTIGPDGRVRWDFKIPYLISDYRNISAGEPVWERTRAVTENGTLYITLLPSDNSEIEELLAISPDGKLLWGKDYGYVNTPGLIAPMNGLLYVKFYNNTIAVYDKNGVASEVAPEDIPPGLFNESTAGNGINYNYKPVSSINHPDPHYPHYTTVKLQFMDDYSLSYQELLGNRTPDQLDTIRAFANDSSTGSPLWNFTIPIEKRTTVVVNRSNVRALMVDYDAVEKDNTISPAEWYRLENVTYGTKIISSMSSARLIPTKDVLYVGFWTYNYEVPTFFNKSNCTYAGGVYAIDNTGKLIWSKMTDSRIIAVQANNETVYYATGDGKVSSTRVDAMAGFALSAFFYLFIRFFLAGAVTRARSLVDSNKNRSLVLKFITETPGVSMYDISKSLKVNLGTVRYHLMILEINHRITPYKADDKYVRYFTNAGSYSEEQQLVISLMRRDGINKVLNKLMEKPGLSNMELAREIGALDSSTIRQVKELSAKGIIIKEQTGDGRLVYSVSNEHKGQIALAAERFFRKSSG